MTAPDARGAVTAIVLAGGRAARFGRDKLAESVDGRPLLEHVLASVAGVATDVVVVRPPDGPSSPMTSGRIIRDPEPFGGPLVGVLAGLEAAHEPIALVVAGDMPRLAPAVLRLLVRSLESGDPDDVDAVNLSGRGRIQPLPIAVRTGAGTTAARHALGREARSLMAWLDALRVRTLSEQEWRVLDPDEATLIDIDRPGDLERLRPR